MSVEPEIKDFPFSLKRTGLYSTLYNIVDRTAEDRKVFAGKYYETISVLNALEKAYRLGRRDAEKDKVKNQDKE